MGLDAGMEENPKKFYIAYKTSQNIVCMEIKKSKICSTSATLAMNGSEC